ncbi:MAG TPA: two-component regulator propeller domain-containing protein, partial [Pyrinomonadaceae bacterium]|nr:two-component regulator propeller domain-containing protein [Pyrinomonadaceae bacterium]
MGFRKKGIIFSFVIILFTAELFSLLAEVLPTKIYTTADGLLRDAAVCIEQDSHGFLWFCTGGGLTRFDGYEFTNYTTDDGLPHSSVNDFLEARDGTIWLATGGGLVKFNPRGKRAPTEIAQSPETAMFVAFKPSERREESSFKKLVQAKDGAIWGGTFDGIFRVTFENGTPNFEKFQTGRVEDMRFDRRGNLWITTLRNGVFRILPDKRIENFTEGLPKELAAIYEDRNGRIWLASRRDKQGFLCELNPETSEQKNIIKKCYTEKDDFLMMWIFDFWQRENGDFWLASSGGFIKLGFKPDGKPDLKFYKQAEGFCDGDTYSIYEDRDSNFWIGTTCGIVKLSPNGFTRYGTADGLSNVGTTSIFGTSENELFIEAARKLNRFTGTNFETIRPNISPQITNWGWGVLHTIIKTRDGDWRIPPAQNSLYRFSGVKNVREIAQKSPSKIYGAKDGLIGNVVLLLYEDKRGDIWIQTLFPSRLYRWERAADKFHDLSELFGLEKEQEVSSFAEDTTGNIWFGTSGSFNLRRFRNGIFERFSSANGVPAGNISDLFTDSQGRLWLVSGSGGAARIDEPNADSPGFKIYNTQNGLSDNSAFSVAEDNFGRIYIGNGRGVDRLDLQTERVKRFTTNDGLPRGKIEQIFKDSSGAIWFGSVLGVSRFVP